MRKAKIIVPVAYDEDATDAGAIAESLQSLVKQAQEESDELEEHGELRFGAFEVDDEEDEDG